MEAKPIIARAGERIAASGARLAVHEWHHGEGGGPALHIHHDDDEAWHILAGVLRFRFAERTFDATAGATVLGHTTLAVTRMYVDLVSRDLEDAHRRASPGENLRVRQR